MEVAVISACDSREYRVIRLRNGLTALLVSDTSGANELSPDYCSIEEETAVESSSELEGDDSDSNGELESEIEETKDVKMAAAGLCIGVGSFSDPPDIPGLAHLLEHMVFMGSQKYPEERSFDAFIQRRGGSDNASTDCETTLFQFEVLKMHFREALDRFAQCFVAPLLKKSSIDAEIEIVDSEFKMSLPVDDNRKQQLFGSFAVEGHPMRKFMWGNVSTLKSGPTKQNINVSERLFAFWKRYYSAHLMTLAVQSQEPLDTLQQWVTEMFSDVPSNFQPRPTFASLTSRPFDTEDFYKIYRVSSVRRSHTVDINWALPSILLHYRAKPLHYLWFLVGHEGKGSILSYLKRRFWALDLTVDDSESGFESNSSYALFNVCVELTAEGMAHLYEVLTAVFAYIELLRRVGPQEWVFNEIRTTAENDFQFEEATSAVDYVETLCHNMQLYAPLDYVTGNRLLFDFDEQVIAGCQKLLTPERANVMVVSERFVDDVICDRCEPWFQTVYNKSDLDPNWLNSWKCLNPADFGFHLPLANKFIATDFSLKKPDIPTSELPIKILDDPLLKLWYKKDERFGVPKAHINFSFVSPLVLSSLQSSVLLDLFVSTLKQNMKEDVYAADAALLNYSVFGNEVGLVICVDGFSQRLPVLLDSILGHVANFSVDDGLFTVVKRGLYKRYYNACLKPNKLCRDVHRSLVRNTYWSFLDKQTVVSAMTKDTLLDFAAAFISGLYIEGLVQGNVTSEEASELASNVCCKLGCTVARSSVLPEVRMLRIPHGNRCCRVASFDNDNSNSVVANYYQFGPADIHQTCLMELLIDVMEEPCFNVLRTRERLGYSVSCDYVENFGILGLMITVCSQEDRFCCSQVDERIESFLCTFGQILNDFPQAEFETQVASRIETKRCVDLQLKEEVDRNWHEILSRCYIFDRLQKEIEHLRGITVQELKAFFKSVCKTTVKKLGIQVVGTAREQEGMELSTGYCSGGPPTLYERQTNSGTGTVNYTQNFNVKTDSKDANVRKGNRRQRLDFGRRRDVIDGNSEQLAPKLMFLPHPNSGRLSEDEVQFIDDIQLFTQKLDVFPVVKITQ